MPEKRRIAFTIQDDRNQFPRRSYNEERGKVRSDNAVGKLFDGHKE